VDRTRWIIVALVLAALLGVSAPTVVKVVKAGLEVDSARPGPDGVVPVAPAKLAADAGVSLEIYSLGRMIASEAGGEGAAAWTAVGWAAVNEASALGKSVFGTLTTSKAGKPGAGMFGRQNLGRYAATGLPPRRGHLELAAQILAGTTPDPTGGARRWISPKAQDALAAKGAKGYRKTAAEVDAARRADGWTPVLVAGIEPRDLTLYRKA
jgi:hypothetical protein